jgi:hypothetical protein
VVSRPVVGLSVTSVEVVVTLKRPPLLQTAADKRNTIRFRLGLEGFIARGARVESSGDVTVGEGAALEGVPHPAADHLDRYEPDVGGWPLPSGGAGA